MRLILRPMVWPYDRVYGRFCIESRRKIQVRLYFFWPVYFRIVFIVCLYTVFYIVTRSQIAPTCTIILVIPAPVSLKMQQIAL